MRHGLYETIVCYVLLANMIWIVVLERDHLKALMDLSVIVSLLWIVDSERDRLVYVDWDTLSGTRQKEYGRGTDIQEKDKKKAKSKQNRARSGKDQVKSKSKVIHIKIIQLEGPKLPNRKLYYKRKRQGSKIANQAKIAFKLYNLRGPKLPTSQKAIFPAPKTQFTRVRTLRKQGRSIGRSHSVPISTRDAYYCRILLNSAKGCRTHDEIKKKVNDVVYPTYKEACYASDLLKDDKKYVDSIKDVTHWAPAEQLCELFVILLLQKKLTTPLTIWLQTWHLLAQNVQYKRRQILKIPYLIVSDDEKRNVCLFYIEELMRSRGYSLRNWPEMPYPDNRYITEFGNRLIYDETDYNPMELQSEYERLYASFITEQKGVYDTIMNSVETGTGDVYFVYGYGGLKRQRKNSSLNYAICLCARYQAKPTKKHLQAVKRIFRYPNRTINMGLWYSKDTDMSLISYADADHTGCQDTRHSTSGRSLRVLR
ncbi:hypothetical protein Tco_0320238 [Tanacetum coccineum]